MQAIPSGERVNGSRTESGDRRRKARRSIPGQGSGFGGRYRTPGFRYPLQKYILEFPAGKLDSGQTPLENAKRELEEETGYRAEVMRYEFSYHTSPGFCDEIIHFFIAEGLTFVAQRLEEGEHLSVISHTLDECLQMIRTGAIADAKTIIGLLWYQQRFCCEETRDSGRS
jgi:8-oxo-dGTP pyrophosphatase MutT (NUDIX family)